MDKKAFLISSSAKNTATPILGTLKDIENMKYFLTSLKGGAWYDSEIWMKDEPSNDDIINIQNYSGDYSLVFIASHGFHNIETNEQYVELNGNRRFPLSCFFTKAKKQLIIVDACREYYDYNIYENFSKSTEAVKQNSANNIVKLYRNKYHNCINDCSDGNIIVYSTDINNVANENKNKGGLFTSELINVAKNNSESVMNIKEAVIHVRKNFETCNINQHPTIDSVRRAKYFPFSININ
ncbi:hypothetical protein A9X77_08370 [Brachyspira hyodysenteriae]|uniref:caspase family protein n=1 Tax=Brachyspira hyodysenteriae TaxID=159 RepID=UPI00063DD223|nr:caspase family protein [Brachyspira hyodysenteriae]KLI27639.1 hypothetical protein SR30_01385 [Brachyspira hyodysenteriae]TVL76929.1 hypothetical protein A9X77_08370 [Brachyspira hyodysenteriae]TVL87463.1 hypothetical protein A9X78_10385 [Brachyspira hyodysenteriae]